jgi:DNA-binding transcriptional regulator YiaG
MKISEIRDKLDMSQEAMAREMGISSQTVYNWERAGWGPEKLKPLSRAAFDKFLRKHKDALGEE